METSSANHVKLIHFWLAECLEKHPLCNLERSGFLPTRLIQLIPGDISYVRLVATHGALQNIRYCTLSHCWGGVSDILTLSSKIHEALQAKIPISNLAKSFRDAIANTRSLGMSYIWIDSLCIIQDSVEDWTRESLNMGSIYENSTCTIAAAGANNSHEGLFFRRDPLKFSPCKIAGSTSECLFLSPRNHEPVPDVSYLKESPLSSRAWVFQETFLSRRIVFFDRLGTIWQCKHGNASEINYTGFWDFKCGWNYQQIFGPEITARDLTTHSLEMDAYTLLTFLDRLKVGQQLSLIDFHESWSSLAAKYSKLKLTKTEDKIVAPSAIAQRVIKITGFTYLAGIWKETLDLDLLWFCEHGRVLSELIRRPAPYRAPAWSWTSIDQKVIFEERLPARRSSAYLLDNRETMFELLSVELATHSLDVYRTGQIHGGSLRNSGKLKKWSGINSSVWRGGSDSYLAISIGDMKIGFHTPDIALPGEEYFEVFLLPLRRIPPQLLGLKNEEWWHDERSLVAGITVRETETKGTYERIGFFQLQSFPCDFASESMEIIEWFDDCLTQEILLV